MNKKIKSEIISWKISIADSVIDYLQEHHKYSGIGFDLDLYFMQNNQEYFIRRIKELEKEALYEDSKK